MSTVSTFYYFDNSLSCTSADDFSTGCLNVSHCHQKFFFLYFYYFLLQFSVYLINSIILQAIPPLPTSSPKQKRYELLLDKPGSYPTMPRREENHVPHTNSTPGKGNLQWQFSFLTLVILIRKSLPTTLPNVTSPASWMGS